MRVYDLTHTISEDILVWPGTEQPRLSEGSAFERDVEYHHPVSYKHLTLPTTPYV